MTDTSTPANTDAPVDPGSLTDQLLGAAMRHGISLLAGLLIAHGLLTEQNTAQFETVATGIATALLAVGWSWLQKRLARKKLITAINAPPPPAPAA